MQRIEYGTEILQDAIDRGGVHDSAVDQEAESRWSLDSPYRGLSAYCAMSDGVEVARAAFEMDFNGLNHSLYLPPQQIQNQECKASTKGIKSAWWERFHDLRHHAITELADPKQ